MSTTTNPLWTRVDPEPGDSREKYVAEASCLGHQSHPILDPWGRPMVAPTHVRSGATRDGEGEVVEWTWTTEIDGRPVRLAVLND